MNFSASNVDGPTLAISARDMAPCDTLLGEAAIVARAARVGDMLPERACIAGDVIEFARLWAGMERAGDTIEGSTK